ncbi:MAG: cyclic nucleotide-binding domain-containing protein [Actinomycetota bacterium]
MTPQYIPSPASGINHRKIAHAETVDILSRLSLFEGAAKRHLREIARHARLEQFEADQDLTVEGHASPSALVIVAGRAVVRRNGRKVADVGPGDIVGELGLLADQPRNATVRTTGPLECLVLDRSGLKAAVLEHPALGWHLLGTVADRLHG